jgi:hypothetical protein
MCHHTNSSALCCGSINSLPLFDLWTHLFCAQLLSGSGTKAVVLGGVDTYVKSRHRVDLYF